jgi:hypothetical protein
LKEKQYVQYLGGQVKGKTEWDEGGVKAARAEMPSEETVSRGGGTEEMASSFCAT